jgi:hypothetical protein
MLSRLACCAVVGALLTLLSPYSLRAGTQEDLFEYLFGNEAKQVQSSKDPKATADLAARVLDTAESTQGDPAPKIPLYQKAYEFGIIGPAGYATATSAAKRLIVFVSEKRFEWQEKLLAVLQLQLKNARTATEKAAATQEFAEQLVAMAEAQAESGTSVKLADYCQQAQTILTNVAMPERDELQARLRTVQVRIAALREVEQLRAKLKSDPQNKAAAESLVQLYLVELDNPAEAAKYAELGADETTQKYLLVAAMKVEGLPENACLSLAEWYGDLADSAKVPAKVAMLKRCKTYCEQFLKKHPGDDASGKTVSQLLDRVTKELARLEPPSGLVISRASYGAGSTTKDVTALVKSKIAGGKISLAVSNASMGGDPLVGASKTLVVEYSYGGQKQVARVPEGQVLTLPPPSEAK